LEEEGIRGSLFSTVLEEGARDSLFSTVLEGVVKGSLFSTALEERGTKGGFFPVILVEIGAEGSLFSTVLEDPPVFQTGPFFVGVIRGDAVAGVMGSLFSIVLVERGAKGDFFSVILENPEVERLMDSLFPLLPRGPCLAGAVVTGALFTNLEILREWAPSTHHKGATEDNKGFILGLPKEAWFLSTTISDAQIL